MFPNRIDSVCFANAKGDLLVSHDKRVSQILYKKYKSKTFDFFAKYPDPLKLTEVSDELFEELREKDDAVRGKKNIKARTRQQSRKQKKTLSALKIPEEGMGNDNYTYSKSTKHTHGKEIKP